MSRLFLSNILFAIGIGIVYFLMLLLYEQAASTWLLNHRYTIASSPTEVPYIALPPVTSTPLPTPLPTPTSTPTTTPLPPTPTPEPQVPVRVVIPDIEVNASIVETTFEMVEWRGEPAFRWKSADYAVAHPANSARPGEAGNMLLTGHNNTAGSVFLRLSELKPGDEVIVYTADDTFTYHVESSEIVLWNGANEEQLARHFELGGYTPDETLTLISCWPYVTYSHRIYVRAKPVYTGYGY